MADRWEDWFEPGETLIWEGSPAPGVRKPIVNILFAIFGTPFLLVGLFVSFLGLGYFFGLNGDWSLLSLPLGLFLTLFGIPFILAGGAMVFGSWLQDYLRPRRVRYALTQKNGYVASRYWNRAMEVLPVRPDTTTELERNRDGTMDIWFHFEARRDTDGDIHMDKKGFEAVRDGETVYRMIRNLKAGLPVDTEDPQS